MKNHTYGRHVVIGIGGWMSSSSNVVDQIALAKMPSTQTNYSHGVAIYSYASPPEGSDRTAFIAALTTEKQNTSSNAVFATRTSPPDMPWKTKPSKGHLMGFASSGSKTNLLDGVEIKVNGQQNATLKTDGTGFYGAVDLTPGEYRLVARFAGYKSITNSISITAGKVTSSDVVLEKSLK